MTRRLAAILVADVAGYSRLMHQDENATHAQCRAAIEDVIGPVIAGHDGRIVKLTGDGFIAEFSSAVAAVQSALEFQQLILTQAAAETEERRLLFRVGIDVGDVIIEKGDIYGDHVNIAARLQQLADPGGLMVSGFVHEYVRGRLSCSFHDAGEQQLRNISHPIRIFRVTPDRPALPQAAPRRTLRLSLFGAVSLWSGEREIRIKSRKLRAIIGYLALSETLYETREHLVGLLWSESSEEQARAVLRQVIRELRGLVAESGATGLRIDTREITLDRTEIETDVWLTIQAAESGEVHPLLLERPLLADELMAGLEDLDPAFRVWLLAKRHALRDRLVRALEMAADRQSADSREAARIAEAILNLDPTHEGACRQLMRARAMSGDTAGALRAYKALWDLLDADYGMEPSAATQQLVTQIKLGELEPAPRQPTPAAASPGRSQLRLILAVEPVNMPSVEPAKTHLITGFHQSLIASLVRFREWQVTDAPIPPSGTGDSAGHYDLQISASQSDDDLHLTLMLKELHSGFYIWSDGFALKLQNWFDAQRRVVQRVAMALNVHLSAERLQRLAGQPDISLSIYDRWLRSQTRVRTFDPQHWQALEHQFREIIAEAPGFVPAYCGLADMHSIEHIAHPGVRRTREREQRALDLARRAVQLDPADMRPHRSMAWAHAMAKQYAQAETHMEVASQLNANDSWTAISLALLLAFCGHADRATERARIALDMTLSPSRTHWAYQVDIQFLSGNYAAAIEAADHAQDVLWGIRAWRTAALAHLGRLTEAQADAQVFVERVRANWFGRESATDQAIMQWLLHLYPIRRREDWERLRDGLRAAGLVTEGAQHHGW